MNPEIEEMKLIAKKDQFRTKKKIDAYIREMMQSALIEMAYATKKYQNTSFRKYEELKREYEKLKETYQEIEQNPKKFVSPLFLEKKFENDFLIKAYFNDYESYIESQYPEIQKLNFLEKLVNIIKGQKALKEIQVNSLTQTYCMNFYETPYGIMGLGDLNKHVTQEFLGTLKEKSNQTTNEIAATYAKEIRADVYTGYINSPIPELRTISSWLEKDDCCYDLNTATVMPKDQYYEFYNPHVINQVSYHELKEDQEIPSVLFLAYQKLNEEQKKKKLEL